MRKIEDMMISHEFDIANEEYRKAKAVQTAKTTAKKLNGRLRLFVADVKKNPLLTKTQKEQIIQEAMSL